MMNFRVFVDGQEGTTGLRINEMLAGRSDIEVLRIEPGLRKDAGERARLLNAADVAFLCLPDLAAREAASLITNDRTCLIDASTAHRTDPGWTFGMPELCADQRARIRVSKRISNPGCHSTPFILLLRPLVETGLISDAAVVAATSITGYSGGGRKMIEQYESGSYPLLNSPRPYALMGTHKHIPEMQTHVGLKRPPLFLPVVSNFYRGLAVSVPLHMSMLQEGITGQAVHEALSARYAGEAFVRVMPLSDPATLESGYFDVQGSNDTNRCDLFVFASDKQIVLIGRIDNLGKGASGAAVQSMNLHLGLGEGAGL